MGDRRHPQKLTTGTPPLALEVRARLRADDPLDLLVYVSTLVETAEHASGDEVDLDVLVETLTFVDSVEATALLMVLSHLLPQGELRVAARRTLMRRHQDLPSWLRDLDRSEVTDAARVTEGRGIDNIVVLGIRWPGGQLATAVVETEDQSGVVVRDARVTPDPFRTVLADLSDATNRTGPRLVEVVGMEVARRVVQRGLGRDVDLPLAFISDTWPANRPLLRWLLNRMPLVMPTG